MFLGVAKALRGLPDESKAFIADHRHYDYDASGFTGIPLIPYQDPMPESPTETAEGIDTLPPKTDSLSIDYQNNGIAYPQNSRQNAHDLDSDKNICLKETQYPIKASSRRLFPSISSSGGSRPPISSTALRC
jgi:hypothetical protein